MLKVVCDINTLVSGFLFKGNESKLLNLAADKKIKIFISSNLIEDFSRVLRYPHLAPKYSSHEEIMDILLEICEIVNPTIKVKAVKDDPDDDKVLECALEAKANYIVSGDKHLLDLKEYKSIPIIKTSQILKEIK